MFELLQHQPESNLPTWSQKASAQLSELLSPTRKLEEEGLQEEPSTTGGCVICSPVMDIKSEPLETPADEDHQLPLVDNAVFIKVEPQLESKFEQEVEQGLFDSSALKEEIESDGTSSGEIHHSSFDGIKSSNSEISADGKGYWQSLESNDDTTFKSSVVRRHLCTACGKSFTRRSTLKNHLATHTREKSHLCFQCGKTFTSELYLKVHCRTHTDEKKYFCPTCGKPFALAVYLRRHMLIHSEVKPHRCSECNKTFSNRRYLLTHKSIHSEGKLHQCNECNKTFGKRRYFLSHLLSHKDVMPHYCTLCPKVFSDNYSLRSHILIHQGLRPYECSICNKVFGHKGTLVNHTQTHFDKSHACDTCGRSFTHPWHLKTHILTHKKG